MQPDGGETILLRLFFVIVVVIVVEVGIEMSIDKTEWKLSTMLFADDTVLLAETEKNTKKWKLI